MSKYKYIKVNATQIASMFTNGEHKYNITDGLVDGYEFCGANRDIIEGFDGWSFCFKNDNIKEDNEVIPKVTLL